MTQVIEQTQKTQKTGQAVQVRIPHCSYVGGIYATQGGGFAFEDTITDRCHFLLAPEGYTAGDAIPSEWGTGPLSLASPEDAKALCKLLGFDNIPPVPVVIRRARELISAPIIYPSRWKKGATFTVTDSGITAQTFKPDTPTTGHRLHNQETQSSFLLQYQDILEYIGCRTIGGRCYRLFLWNGSDITIQVPACGESAPWMKENVITEG